MKGLITLLCAFFLLSSTVHSQRIVLIEGDSGLFFNQSRASWLLKQVYKVNELTERNQVQQQRVDNLLFGAQRDSMAIWNLREQVMHSNSLYSSEQRVSALLQQSLDQANAEVRRQKWQKWGIVGGATVIIVVVLALGG